MSGLCPSHSDNYDECLMCELELAQERIQHLERENTGLKEYIGKLTSSEEGEYCEFCSPNRPGCSVCGKQLLNE